MRRPMWIGLALVLGLSLYLSTGEGDDSLLTPDRQGAQALPGRARQAAASKSAPIAAKALNDARLSQMLTEGLAAWLGRSKAASQPEPVPLASMGGWAGITPPEPPQPARRGTAETLEEAPPQPPAFTREWVGRFDELGGPKTIERAVLAGPRNTLLVKAGDVIEGQWRVDGIHERTMNLTYLPLNLPLTVAMK
jgi:hypothetical protein